MASTQQAEGFVLHTRHYTDSKTLVSVFAESMGRFTGVIRESKRQARLRPFTQYHFTYSGNGGVKTLRSAEQMTVPLLNQGRRLFCGIYLNELLTRALPEEQPYDQLVQFYSEIITKLNLAEEHGLQEILLRRFEFRLLEEVGLGLSFDRSADQNKIVSERRYQFVPGSGFQLVYDDIANADQLFTGLELQAVASESWDEVSLRAAKRISRLALQPLLGGRPIKARELFT